MISHIQYNVNILNNAVVYKFIKSTLVGMTKYVAQKDEMGCGVACVANKLTISYEQALELFTDPDYAKTIGYKCKYIVEALRGAGQEVRLRHIKRMDRESVMNGMIVIPTGAIVFLEKSELYSYQHYLLKVYDGWLDPWINMPDDRGVAHAKQESKNSSRVGRITLYCDVMTKHRQGEANA
jgi:hypothetical protein